MIRYARHLALAAACLAVVACGSTQTGSPVAVNPGKPAQTSRGADPGSFTPTEKEHDPTKRIKGVVSVEYKYGLHVTRSQRVAYDHKPPLGGAHDAVWAACNGVVYPQAVRTENLVHSLEHGAVWLTYEPTKVSKADMAKLANKVTGQPYTVMSPYPGQPTPVSAQSWGRQLQVDSVDDERIDQFIAATRTNQYLAPEPGASCDQIDPSRFDQDNPPPFDPTDPGPDAIQPTGR
ncbi:DUF3105 domain-containing protein [Actinokineospora inagensis]|uniref:DUF3105 domain-containing protein n=1 Tax=Actinokineospora inagensis TaxID=103730 RepID=UPI00047976C1|nr:DUF3105 domain-containing protein [Actinokineospora inagensis]